MVYENELWHSFLLRSQIMYNLSVSDSSEPYCPCSLNNRSDKDLCSWKEGGVPLARQL